MRPRIGELCAGYGGLGTAVRAVMGGELAWVADNDPGASAILAHRFPSLPNLDDISTADWSAVEPVDVLTAGFPCQDVSCAGGRAGLREGNRTGVWAYVARAIDELRPSLVVLENVRGLLSAGADSDVEPCPWCLGEAGSEHPLRALGAVLGDLADLGYDARWAVVSAADAGAPHRRERVFIAAWPAADADCGAERPGTLEAGRGLVASVAGYPESGRRRDGQHAAAADTERLECQRRGVPRVLGSATAVEPSKGLQRQRPGNPAGYSGTATLEDADSPTGGERWQSAPRQATGGRPWSDTCGSGGTPATTDADNDAARARREPGDAGRRGTEPAQCCDTPSDSECGAGDRRPVESVRGAHRRDAADRDSAGRIEWGPYELAIRRWERVLGRPAPAPTEPGRTGQRLSPRFVEWLMGLPEGWVTDVPGLSRNAQLKALGNGVVPAQAAMALRMLLDRADIPSLVAAKGDAA